MVWETGPILCLLATWATATLCSTSLTPIFTVVSAQITHCIRGKEQRSKWRILRHWSIAVYERKRSVGRWVALACCLGICAASYLLTAADLLPIILTQITNTPRMAAPLKKSGIKTARVVKSSPETLCLHCCKPWSSTATLEKLPFALGMKLFFAWS